MRSIYLIPLLLVLFSFESFAQCGFDAIDNARDDYEIGRFLNAKQSLQQCFDNGGFINSNTENRALRMLALIAIAEDDIQSAETHILQIIKNDPDFADDPHLVFDAIFKRLAKENQIITVSSVSKKSENIRTAPASVLLITREEILNRGYVDIVELLSDLPGFNISKIYSATYANIFQLGFRQENTERTLLMVDGVEENDIWSNIAYLSRQYPMSSIKAVEILYGPSSTMYGPRAFVGAINIITYAPGEKPSDSFGDNASDKDGFYGSGLISVGSYKTKDADLMLGYKSELFNATLTGRYYYSDENNLDFVDFYDYSPDDINIFSYEHFNLYNNFSLAGQPISLNQYLDTFNIPLQSPFFNIFSNNSGSFDSIIVSQEGIDAARNWDKNAYTGIVNGHPAGYSNHTKDYYIGGKLSFNFFELGFRTWRREEGFNYYQDIYAAGSKNGNLWVPKNTTFYAKYERNFEKISFSNLLSFHNHSLDRATNRVNFRPLGNSANRFHLAHLFYPDQLLPNTSGSAQIKPGYSNLYFYYEGRQFRNDARFYYSEKNMNLMAGVEFRSSQMQGDYLTYTDYDYTGSNKQDTVFLAQELGTVNNQEKGSNQFPIIDFGTYFQGNFSLIPSTLILTGAARIDYNRIRATGGYGWDFSPRFTLVYYNETLFAKAIYSRGIQNVSQWTKFSTGGGRTANPELGTEKIDYASLSIGGSLNDQDIDFELMAFYSGVKDAVSSSKDDAGILMNRNVGEYSITGLMGIINYHPASLPLDLALNYTLLNPYQVETDNSRTRLGDIAAHHLNLLANYRINIEGLNINLNARGNYVSAQPVGPNTTQTGNPGLDNTGEYPAYLILNGSLTLSHEKFKSLILQFTVNNFLNGNLLDSALPPYYHAGPRTASANYINNLTGNVPYIPQRGRHFFIRTSINF
jgi:outer membrane receptor for ferrienterochelin and colicins